MLAMVPIRRKSVLWILATALWNFILCLPFLIAFFILTETRDDGVTNQYFPGTANNVNTNGNADLTNFNAASDYRRYNAKGTEIYPDGTQRFTDGTVLLPDGTREYNPRVDEQQNCFFIPWGYANYARWGFLALCIYWLAIIPFNLWVLKQRKQNRESRWTPWLTMADCLVWVYSLGQWIYAVMALSNRGACPDGRIRGLIWSNVWIAAMLFALELFIALILLLIAVTKLKKDLEGRVGYVKNAGAAFMGMDRPVVQTTTTTAVTNPVVTNAVVVENANKRVV